MQAKNKQFAVHTESSQKQHIDKVIVAPVRLHRQIPTVQAVQIIKLQFIDKVVDISVNMQKLAPTVRVPHVQRKDELAHHRVGRTNAYRAES